MTGGMFIDLRMAHWRKMGAPALTGVILSVLEDVERVEAQ